MKKWAVGAIILVGVLTWQAVEILRVGGAFFQIVPHFDGRCRPIGGMAGPEDITIDPDSGVAFVSSSDRRAWRAGTPSQGAIYALDLKVADPVAVELTRSFELDLQPHGVSLFRDGGGLDRLFVVNHPEDRHTIEIFDLSENALVHRETIHGELLRSPNDVFAVGRRSFYVTNDHRNVTPWRRLLEDLLRLADSDVVFFDGGRFRTVAEGIGYPNGITGRPDGSAVFIASTTGRSVLHFERDRMTGALVYRERYDLATGVDNLEMDPTGRIWVGAHPNMLAFMRNARAPSSLSPSQVLLLDPATGGFEEVFASAGDDLSTSSVAAVYGNKLLVGSVFEPHVLFCEMREQAH